jgi:hypothetical protein
VSLLVVPPHGPYMPPSCRIQILLPCAHPFSTAAACRPELHAGHACIGMCPMGMFCTNDLVDNTWE